MSRAIAAIIFITIALIPEYTNITFFVFAYACLSDLIDGFLARKLSCTSKTGGAIDLFSDKYLTIICSIYAVMRGIPVFPCAIIILREVFLLSLRSIYLEGVPLFPSERVLGALTIVPIWLGTLVLIKYPQNIDLDWYWFIYFYYIIGLIVLINLTYKINKNWKKIVQSFKT